jgi:hypothetical protein
VLRWVRLVRPADLQNAGTGIPDYESVGSPGRLLYGTEWGPEVARVIGLLALDQRTG